MMTHEEVLRETWENRDVSFSTHASASVGVLATANAIVSVNSGIRFVASPVNQESRQFVWLLSSGLLGSRPKEWCDGYTSSFRA